MSTRNDLFTMKLPLEFYDPTPQPLRLMPVAAPGRAYLDWRRWRGDDTWITRWAQDGQLLAAKIVVGELLNPDAPTDRHRWAHSVSVHTCDDEGIEIARVALEVQSPLYDFDIFPMLDHVVYECGDEVVAFANGLRQQTLLH